MSKIIEECPNCKAYVEGQADLSVLRIATSKGTAMGINKLIVWMIATPIISSFIFPIFGTFLGFIISFCIFLYIQNYSKNVSQKIDKKLFETTSYIFTCPSCGKTWKKTVNTGTSIIPDEKHKKQKDDMIDSTASIANTIGIIALCTAALTIIGLIYCNVTEASYLTGAINHTFLGDFEERRTNWWWYLWGIIWIISGIMTIIEYNVWKNYNNKCVALKHMSLSEFQNTYFK